MNEPSKPECPEPEPPRNGQWVFMAGALGAFAAAQATAMAIDNLTTRAVVQVGTGLAMFVAGVFVRRPGAP